MRFAWSDVSFRRHRRRGIATTRVVLRSKDSDDLWRGTESMLRALVGVAIARALPGGGWTPVRIDFKVADEDSVGEIGHPSGVAFDAKVLVCRLRN